MDIEFAETLNHRFAALGWGALFVWWGIVILVEPMTIGMGAIGTGLIFLGINALRALKGIPARESTTTLGVIALAWGGLDLARWLLGLPGDLSFALLLIVIGVVVFLAPLLGRTRPD